METLSALLAISVGNSPVIDKFPAQRAFIRKMDWYQIDKKPVAYFTKMN